MTLPRKVGVFTVVRLHDTDEVSESFVAILDEPAARRVLARRITGEAGRGPRAVAALRQRVAELRTARHPSLARVFDVVEAEGEVYVLEAWSDGVPLSEVLNFCRLQGRSIPIELFLHLATQLCDALEELHGRPPAIAAQPGAPVPGHVLHLALCPAALQVTLDGRITVGRYGLFREGPMAAAHGVEYLAPEQTRPAPKLLPATDVFALGAVLYELLTGKPLFRADHVGRTLERIRNADIHTALVEVREVLPGLEKVMFRALSANPQHRYQRAFVLREDLRGLMVGYAFSDIAGVARGFLGPVVRAAHEWYHSGALAAPAPRREAAPDAAPPPDGVETVASPAPAPRAAGGAARGPAELPETEWFARGPTGAHPPLRRRPIERLPDTTRIRQESTPPWPGDEDNTERTRLPLPEDRETVRHVLPILTLGARDGEQATATLSLEIDDTERSSTEGEVPSGLVDLPTLASGGEADDFTDRLPRSLLDPPPLPVAVASAARPPPVEHTETAVLGPVDDVPLLEVSRSETAQRVQPDAPVAAELPAWARFRVEDVPLPAPLDRVPSRPPVPEPSPAVVEDSDPEVPWGTVADEGVASSEPTEAASTGSAVPLARPKDRSPPVVPLAAVALLTAVLCVLLCLGPPAGVLWAAAVNGTYPHEVFSGGRPVEVAPVPPATPVRAAEARPEPSS